MTVVTRDLGRLWVAQLVPRGVAIEHDTFDALTDAQAWCMSRLRELAALDRCE